MAISSPLSLKSITGAIFSTKKVSEKSKANVLNISKILNQNITEKRNLYSKTKTFRMRRIESEKRNVIKDRLAAPILAIRPKGFRILSSMDKGTSIVDRLLGFVGYMSAGWILGNLPTWIGLGEQFSQRILQAGNILSNYGDELVRLISNIGGVMNSALVNVSRFDFTDDSFLVRSSLNELKLSIDDLGEGISSAFDVLLKPFSAIEKVPDAYKQLPSILPGFEKPEQPQQPSVGGGNADFWTLVAVASREDGDPQGQADVAQSIYNRAASGAYGSKSIRGLILRYEQYQPTWERPKKGKYGQPNKEWYSITDAESAAKASGLSVAAIQSVARNIQNPTLQKNAAKFVGGRTDFKGYDVPGSIQRKSGDNWFGWEYNYRGTKTASVPNFGTTTTPPTAKVTPTPLPVPPPLAGQRRLVKKDILTKSLGRNVDYIEIGDLYLGRGGSHKGIDIRAPLGTHIALRVDAEWVAYGYQEGGYGHVLDVWVPSLGVQLRFAHLAFRPNKLSKIPAGTSFAQVGSSGNSSGPHIHFEYDTIKGSSRGGGAGNPEPYVRLLLLSKNPLTGKFSPAAQPTTTLTPRTPSVATQTQSEVDMEGQSYLNGVADGITQERSGRKVVVIDDRQESVQQIIAAGGNSGIDIQVNKSALLNNFIKNKLLLDLNYV